MENIQNSYIYESLLDDIIERDRALSLQMYEKSSKLKSDINEWKTNNPKKKKIPDDLRMRGNQLIIIHLNFCEQICFYINIGWLSYESTIRYFGNAIKEYYETYNCEKRNYPEMKIIYNRITKNEKSKL